MVAKKSDLRPFHCLRCGSQHPPTATHCDCRTPPVPLISRNHPAKVKDVCESYYNRAVGIACNYMGNNRKHEMELLSHACCALFDVAAKADLTCPEIKLRALISIAVLNALRSVSKGAKIRDQSIPTSGSDITDVFSKNPSVSKIKNRASEADLETREIVREVQEACSYLSDDERRIVVAHFVEGLPLPEVAQSLNIHFKLAFQMRERAVLEIKKRLTHRLGISDLTSRCGKTWLKSNFRGGTFVAPDQIRKLLKFSDLILDNSERFFVIAHFVDGIETRHLGSAGCLPRSIGEKFLLLSIEKLRPYVRFDSHIDFLKNTGLLCLHCQRRKVHKDWGRCLCYTCGNDLSIKLLYPQLREVQRLHGQDDGLTREKKTCANCSAEKPLSDYPKRKHNPDGTDATCKACINRRIRAYRKAKRQAQKQLAAHGTADGRVSPSSN